MADDSVAMWSRMSALGDGEDLMPSTVAKLYSSEQLSTTGE